MSSDAIERRDMFHIRPLPGGPSPPLDRIMRSKVPYGQVIERMQVTGFHRWGLLILRATTYADQAKWDTFLARIRASAEHMMTRKPPGLPREEATPALLLPLLRWDVLEDREVLECAGVENARRRFIQWRAEASVERDGEGADHLSVRLGLMARFRYFVLVDDECLASLTTEEGKGWDEKSERRDPPVKVKIVDAGPPSSMDHLRGGGTFTAEGAGTAAEVGQGQDDDASAAAADGEDSDESGGDDQFSSVEGRTEWDVGWMWVEARFLLSFYNILQAESGWDHFYTRPPKVYGR